MADDKPKSSTTSKVAATGAGISIAAIIGIYSQVSPIIHAIKPDIAIKVDGVVDDIRKLQPTIDKITDQIKIIQDQQKKVEPTPAPVPVIDDRDKQIQELRDKINELIKPPAPIPAPQPTPSIGLKVVDSTGKEITEPIESGKQFKVVSSVAGKWSIASESKPDDYDVIEYPDHLVCTLRNGAKVFVSHASESPLTLTSRILSCQGPRPPPPPVPDDHSSKPRKLFIAVVEDVRNRSPETATTLSDLESWNTFRDKGHEWRFYDQSTQESRGIRAVQSAKTQTFDPPQIVIHDSAGEFVYAGVLPDMAGVRELVAKYGGA